MPQLSVFLLPHIPEEQFGFIPGTGTLDVGAVQAIASDARKRLGAIRRMSHMLDDKSIMRAYTKLLCAQRLSMAAWPTGELQKAI